MAFNMFEAFFATLGTMVANKKILGSWLILLSMALGATGDRVFRVEPQHELTVTHKLDKIQESLNEIKNGQSESSKKLNEILLEQAKVRTELDIKLGQEKNGKK